MSKLCNTLYQNNGTYIPHQSYYVLCRAMEGAGREYPTCYHNIPDKTFERRSSNLYRYIFCKLATDSFYSTVYIGFHINWLQCVTPLTQRQETDNVSYPEFYGLSLLF